jgi:hypothetical protein
MKRTTAATGHKRLDARESDASCAKRTKRDHCTSNAPGKARALPFELWVIIIRMALAPNPFRGMFDSVPHIKYDVKSLRRIQSAVLANTRRAIRLTCKLFAQVEAQIRGRAHVNSLDVASADFDFYSELDFGGASSDRLPPSSALLEKTLAKTVVNMPMAEMKTMRISDFVRERIEHVSLVATTTLQMQNAGCVLKKCNTQKVKSIKLYGEAAGGTYSWDRMYGSLMQFTQLRWIELAIVPGFEPHDMSWLQKNVPLLERLSLRNIERPANRNLDVTWPTTILSTRFSDLELESCICIPSFIFAASVAPHMRSLRVRHIEQTRAFEPDQCTVHSSNLSLLTNLCTLELAYLYFDAKIKKLSVNSALPNLQRLIIRSVMYDTQRDYTCGAFFFDGPCKKLAFLFIDQNAYTLNNDAMLQKNMLPSSFFPAVESLFTSTCLDSRVFRTPNGVHIDKRGLRALRVLDLTGARDMCDWWFDGESRMLPASIETLAMPLFPQSDACDVKRVDLSNLTRLERLTACLYDSCHATSYDIVAPPRYTHLELVCENLKHKSSKRPITAFVALLPRDRRTLKTLTVAIRQPTVCTLSPLEMAKLFRVTLDKEGCTDVKISIL